MFSSVITLLRSINLALAITQSEVYTYIAV
jgi:hypothetical protein